MHHFFTDSAGGQHIYVLYGLGGAGKTQIALKFIKKSASSFSDIFFIDASATDNIDSGLKNIAMTKHTGQSSKAALQWLTSKVDKWLLFFDNADDPSIDLNEFLPQCDHGNIIITSRNYELCHYAGSHSLISDLEEADAVELLLKSAHQKFSPKSQQIAAEIVKTLGYLALAIVQAGAFIFKSGTFDSYLNLYAKHRKWLLSKKPAQSHDSYAWTVYTTWKMSFDRLKPVAQMFLQLCSFLHYKGISEELFCNASKFGDYSYLPSKDELQRPCEFLSNFLAPTGEWDTLQFLDVTSEIRAYSLIDFDSEKNVFSIHPLVHAWSREMVRDPESIQSTLGSILGMAIKEMPVQDIELALILLPHVESILEVNSEIAPDLKAQYAWIFFEAGKYKQAEKLQIEVLNRCKELLGDNHTATLKAMSNLVYTYSKLSDFRKAQKLSIVVLEKQKQLLGHNHLDTLEAMDSLATTYCDLREFRKAEALEFFVLENRKQLLGEDHPDTLRAMGNLGQMYSRQGEFTKSEELEILVLEKWKQLLGDNHPNTLRGMTNLASTYWSLGQFTKAEELEVVVLEKHRQTLGDDHPRTLRAVMSLANIYYSQDKLHEADELRKLFGLPAFHGTTTTPSRSIFKQPVKWLKRCLTRQNGEQHRQV